MPCGAAARDSADWWQNTGHAEAIAHLTERFGPMADWGQEAFEEVFLHDVDPAVAREAARFSGAPGHAHTASSARQQRRLDRLIAGILARMTPWLPARSSVLHDSKSRVAGSSHRRWVGH